MNSSYIFSLILVIILCVVAYMGGNAEGLRLVFGVMIPYLAVFLFVLGFLRKVLGWAKSPVPFSIASTCGQQKSMPWVEQNKLDNPSTTFGVIIRMFLEIVCFRSLFRNTRMRFHKSTDGVKIAYDWEIFLWAGALAFHYAFLVVLLRHLRFFFQPVPWCIQVIEFFDGFFKMEFVGEVIDIGTLQIGLPGVFVSGLILLAAVIFLCLRRLMSPKVRYISLASDYFPLFVILGIAVTGIVMRYFAKIDIVGVKAYTMGLVMFKGTLPPENVGGIFYIHLFLVCVLLACFPFSKLMHMGGIFLSPTRNMTGNTREVRHVNPWNYPVKTHTYEEYEDDYRDKMIGVGLPVDKKE